jgi:hypothetical protein
VITLYAVEMGHPWAGDIAGALITADGERLATHVSSTPAFLLADLTQNFGRGAELAARFGQFTVVYVALDDPIPDEISEHVMPMAPQETQGADS